MSTKVFVVLCAQALFAHIVYSQCVRSGCNYAPAVAVPSATVSSCNSLGSNGLAYNGLGFGSGLGIGAGISNGFTGAGLNAGNIQYLATSGGALPVYSASAIAPSPLSVASENAFEGSLHVLGELPFLSAVALEGVLPSGGSGIVNYGCGNGITAITGEAIDSASNVYGSTAHGSGLIGHDFGLSPIASAAVNCGHAAVSCGHPAVSCGHAVDRACGCGLY